MKQRVLIISSLFLLTVLLIAGCQQTVGGGDRSKYPLQTRESQVITATDIASYNDPNSGLGYVAMEATLDTSTNCLYPTGVWIIDTYSGGCYQSLGCLGLSVVRQGPNQEDQMTQGQMQTPIIRPTSGNSGDEMACRQGGIKADVSLMLIPGAL